MIDSKEISVRQYEIIEAAGKILTASGVGGLTIKNLAKEMQFSESAIYRHFTGREEIITGMLEFLAESMDKRLGAVVLKGGSPEEKFNAIFQSQFTFFSKNPHFIVSVFCDGLMEESQRINETILKLMEVKKKYLIPIIKEGQKSGHFINQVSSDELVHIVIGSFRLLMYKWRVSNFNFDIKRKGTGMIQSLLTMIKNN